MEKNNVHVVIGESSVSVCYNGGMYYNQELSSAWRCVLTAVANPDKHIIEITDCRENFSIYKPDLTKLEDEECNK